MTLQRSFNEVMPFALHDCFEFKGVEYSVPEYSIFPKGSKFIQKYVITPANILYIKKTAESLTYRNFQTNNSQYESRVFLSVFF